VRLQRLAITVTALCLLISVEVLGAAPPNDTCNLPQDLQREIVSKYPGARLVSLADLEEDDRKFFQADHKDSCPGLVGVDFYGDGKPTLALVLIPKGGINQPTELIIAHQAGDRWRTTILDTGGPSPYAPVVWSQPPGEYRDVYGKKTIRATRPVIVFCKYESWSILYSWTGKDVSKIWIAD
jgi:hypothetical protein